MSSDMLTFLHKMYVRPHLEYCIPVWCPYFAKSKCSDVPPSLTLLSDISHLPYETRLLKLGLYSTETRTLLQTTKGRFNYNL